MVKLTAITYDADWVSTHAYDCTHGVVCDIKVHREKEIFEPMSEVYRTCCSALRVVRDKVNKGLIEQHDTKLVYLV